MLRLIKWVLVLSPILTGALIWLALDDTPAIEKEFQLSHQDIVRAQSMLKRYDPRRLPAGTPQTVLISENDLNLALSYLASRVSQLHLDVQLEPDLAMVAGSLRLPLLPVRNVLNLKTSVSGSGSQFKLVNTQLGSLPIPNMLMGQFSDMLLQHLRRDPQWGMMMELAQASRLHVGEDSVTITYQWDPAILDGMQTTLFSDLDRDAVAAYYLRLRQLINDTPGNHQLLRLMTPLFQLARQRSVDKDPVDENRALLSLLGTWSLGQDVTRLLPGKTYPPRPRFLYRLHDRRDFAQHFLGSAAVSIQGDSHVAEAVGTLKEVVDTDQGSGFSFTDLAADLAGARFGSLAIRDETTARQLQQMMSAGIQEFDILPYIKDLPEYLKGDRFRDRYGEVGSPEYRRLVADIEGRIDRARLYRALD